MNQALLDIYHSWVKEKKILSNQAQEHLLQEMGHWWEEASQAHGHVSWLKRLKTRFQGDRSKTKVKCGLYLYGSVGRGKTMLMTLLYQEVPLKKRKVHFHVFMIYVHRLMRRFRRASSHAQPIERVAHYIAKRYQLLYLDELEIRDIADAMIIGRLVQELLKRHVLFLITTNLAPEDLYKNGLHYERFYPFVELLKKELKIITLDTLQDYRRLGALRSNFYFSPLNDKTRKAVTALYKTLTHPEKPAPLTLRSKGREVYIPFFAGGVAMGSFQDFCGKPLGNDDYLLLAGKISVLIVTEIPKLTPSQAQEGRRFIQLVDIFYDAQKKMVATAHVPLDEVWPEHQEFARTCSRLMEMTRWALSPGLQQRAEQ